MSIPPQPGFMDRHGRWMVMAAVALALGGIGYRLWRGGTPLGAEAQSAKAAVPPGPPWEEASPDGGATLVVARTGGAGPLPAEGGPAGVPRTVATPEGRAPRLPAEALAQAGPARTVTAEEQTAAIREAVVRDTLQTIRLAALRGDEATIRGLVPGLKYQRKTALKILEQTVQREDDTAARVALQDVMAQLD